MDERQQLQLLGNSTNLTGIRRALFNMRPKLLESKNGDY
jgi:hypothetical protein